MVAILTLAIGLLMGFIVGVYITFRAIYQTLWYAGYEWEIKDTNKED